MWSIREKLCLASCVQRMNENWPLISRQMRQLCDTSRPIDFYSQKNCAQQYTSLVEAVNAHNLRKRAASESVQSPSAGQNAFGSSAGSPENLIGQLVSRLTLERLEELRSLMQRERNLFKKLLREIEAVKSGEYDSQLEAMLENEEKYGVLGGDSGKVPTVAESAADKKSSATPAAKPDFANAPETSAPTTPLYIGHADSPSLLTSPSRSPALLVYSQLSPTKSVIRSPPPTVRCFDSPVGQVPTSNVVATADGNDAKEVAVNVVTAETTPSSGATPQQRRRRFTDDVGRQTPTGALAAKVGGGDGEPRRTRRSAIGASGAIQKAAVAVRRRLSERFGAKRVGGGGGAVVAQRPRRTSRSDGGGLKTNEAIEKWLHGVRQNHQVALVEPEHVDVVFPADYVAPKDTKVDEQSSKRALNDSGDNLTLAQVLTKTSDEGERTASVDSADALVPRVAVDKVGGNAVAVTADSATTAERRRSSLFTRRQPTPATSQRQTPDGGTLLVTLPSSTPSLLVAQSSDFADLESYRAWKRTILNVYNIAAGHKHANLFYKPVLDEHAPFYSRLVKRPMCLNELKKNVETQHILSTAEFKRDLMLVFANAVMYNPKSHEVHRMAVQMALESMPSVEELLQSSLGTASGGVGSVAPMSHAFDRTASPVVPTDLTRTLRTSRASATAANAPPHRRHDSTESVSHKRESSETSSLDSFAPLSKRRHN